MSFVTNLGNAIIGTSKTIAYEAKKHSPELLIGAGIGLGVTATVAACIQTTKLEPVVDDIKDVFDDVHEAHKQGVSRGEHAMNLVRASAYSAKEIGKVYWMPFLLGGASVASILAGFNIIHTRNVRLIAMASAYKKSYDTLYKRVSEEFSPEAADKFANDLKVDEYEETDKKGKVKKKTRIIQDGDGLGPYEWIFGPTCQGYYHDSSYNEAHLIAQRDWCNNMLVLKKDKILTVAEVLTEMHQHHIPQRFYVLGWKLPDDWFSDPNNTSAPYIDWDIEPIWKDYGDGPVKCWKINFNCDGYVWGDIEDEAL